MSWEAHRWTARTPSELYHTLGPHGVSDLVHQMVAACWRSLPEDDRSIAAGIASVQRIRDRNVGVWKKIKKPTPEAFFADLFPTDADGYCRQAMVLTWMMMPRTGGREVADALKMFNAIVDRAIEAWQEDNAAFTGKKSKPAARTAKAKTAGSKPAKAKVTKPKAAGKPKTKSKATGKSVAKKPAKK